MAEPRFDVQYTNGKWRENVSLDRAISEALGQHATSGKAIPIRNRETGRTVEYTGPRARAWRNSDEFDRARTDYERKLASRLRATSGRISEPAKRSTGYAKAGRSG